MTQRAPTHRPSILIIGAGFGGLGMAITLKSAGFNAFTILLTQNRTVWYFITLFLTTMVVCNRDLSRTRNNDDVAITIHNEFRVLKLHCTFVLNLNIVFGRCS